MKTLHIFLILLVMASIIYCKGSGTKGHISKEIVARQEQLATDPDNAILQKSYVIDTIFEIQQEKNPSETVLSDLDVVSKKYILTHDDDDVTFARAQIMFLSARNASAKKKLVRATRRLAEGFQLFDTLYEKRKNDILFRAYRGRYYSSVPKMFRKQDTAIEDGHFIIAFVLDPNNDTWFASKDAREPRRVSERALKKMEDIFDDKGLETTDLKKALAKLASANATDS